MDEGNAWKLEIAGSKWELSKYESLNFSKDEIEFERLMKLQRFKDR